MGKYEPVYMKKRPLDVPQLHWVPLSLPSTVIRALGLLRYSSSDIACGKGDSKMSIFVLHRQLPRQPQCSIDITQFFLSFSCMDLHWRDGAGYSYASMLNSDPQAPGRLSSSSSSSSMNYVCLGWILSQGTAPTHRLLFSHLFTPGFALKPQIRVSQGIRWALPHVSPEDFWGHERDKTTHLWFSLQFLTKLCFASFPPFFFHLSSDLLIIPLWPCGQPFQLLELEP